MNSRAKMWGGIAAAGAVAAFIAFGAGGMSGGDGNSVQAGMARSGKTNAGAPSKSTTGGGKSSQGIAQTGTGNGI